MSLRLFFLSVCKPLDIITSYNVRTTGGGSTVTIHDASPMQKQNISS